MIEPQKRVQAGFAVIGVALFFGAAAPLTALAAQPLQKKPNIRVETTLVTVIASVQTHEGRPVLDLPREEFQISEEGVPQQIERFESETNQPLDLALMIDTSLSTLKDLKFVGETSAHFIRQVVRPGDRLGVFEFSDEVTQLSEFSSNVPALQSAVRRIVSGAGTVMYDAILLGSRALEHGEATRRRVIVLVTDAGETTSRAKFEDARQAAIASGALLYSIVIRTIKSESGRNTAGEHALETITDTTGGAMYYPDSVEELDAMFDRIDRELRTQYLLGYYPRPAPPQGAFRKLEVTVKGDYVVRARKGYLTPGVPR
jgi:Ca-activated chloride channel family protein